MNAMIFRDGNRYVIDLDTYYEIENEPERLAVVGFMHGMLTAGIRVVGTDGQRITNEWRLDGDSVASSPVR